MASLNIIYQTITTLQCKNNGSRFLAAALACKDTGNYLLFFFWYKRHRKIPELHKKKKSTSIR